MSTRCRLPSAMSRQSSAGLKQLLHPYLHWTEDGRTVRGRAKVLALLEGRTALAAPAAAELRDGQVYRWTVTPR